MVSTFRLIEKEMTAIAEMTAVTALLRRLKCCLWYAVGIAVDMRVKSGVWPRGVEEVWSTYMSSPDSNGCNVSDWYAWRMLPNTRCPHSHSNLGRRVEVLRQVRNVTFMSEHEGALGS